VALVVAYGSVARYGNAAGNPRVVDGLLSHRFTSGRLAAQTVWQRCTVADSAALAPRSSCGAALRTDTWHFERLTRAARQVHHAVQRDSSPAALHRVALLELRLDGGTAAALDRAAAAQEGARRRAPANAAVLNDLAVIHLARGERNQHLMPMLQALDAVERALARDSMMVPALFNRALILERLYLVDSARRAWSRYLLVERQPAWRAEAQEHLRRLGAASGAVSWSGMLASPPAAPLDDSTRAEIAGRVARAPGMAREFSFGLFGAWGRAVLREDRARAAALLDLAGQIAGAADSLRADRSVALALETVQAAAADPAGTRALARAHVELAAGFDLFFASSFERAADTLAAAERGLRAAGSPAAGWATFYRAAAKMNLGRFAAADSLYRHAADGATAAEPALRGRAVWALGVTQVRQGNYERAIAAYRQAVPHLERAREPESQATISYLLSEALLLSGQTVPARAEEYRGLRLLSPYRDSRFLNNHLTIVTLDAREAGLPYAALAVMNEVLAVAAEVNRADVLAWAFQARARELAALGQSGAARADLQNAMRWVDGLDPGAGRDRIRADVRLIRGQMLRSSDPDAALDTLAAVVEAYHRVGIGMNLPAGLFEAARAAEATGDRGTARGYLEQAIREIERQQASYHSMELRTTRAETVEHVFDAMIRLELEAGRSASALEFLERSRMAAWTRDARPSSGTGGSMLHARISARLPADMLFLDYALLADRVVVWTASRRGWRHHTVPVSRDSVVALVARFAGEAAEPGARADAARARLFEMLVRPVAEEMRGMRQLTIVPDRELFRLPFAALWDGETGTYVVERYRVRTLPNAGFFLSVAPGARAGADASALVVGNPTVDPRLVAALPNLPAAAREAEQVARLYGTPRVLIGPEARRGAVLEHLPGVSVFHFAGHAVFNGEQPELSYLALASGDADGLLQAREIGELRLSGLQVVVLSACRTLNPRPSRAGGNAGLAYSFLRAGAPATVSTVWDVSDEPTSEVLVEFHRRLAGGVPAPEALRLAQVAVLRSPRPHRRAPAAWAAFVYTGP
jgi:CHAT domain-containing protein